MSAVRRWAGDLALGVRLALAGGRASLVRLVLAAVGMGLSVTVLLLAAATPTMLAAGYDVRRTQRDGVELPREADPAAAGDLLGIERIETKYRGIDLHGRHVTPTGPAAPKPPGVQRLPGPGELIASPALIRLLDSADGELLRPRFPERVVGTIGNDGLTGPKELYFYVGGSAADGTPSVWIRSFDYRPEPYPPLVGALWLLAAAGAAGLLVPTLAFVAATARIGAAARERRLAAIRLVGADGAQVRRIAAGEALVGGLGGVLVGYALFLAARGVVESVSLAGQSVFAEDVRPPWFALAGIAVGTPALAAATAVFALRRVTLEPLGVVRQVPGVRRRLSWRLLPLGAGLVLVAALGGRFAGSAVAQLAGLAMVLGVSLAVLSVPVLLPAVVERAVARLRGGPPSWQLGLRRLQVDSGAGPRAVGGVAAVLTAAIAVQSLLTSLAGQYVTNYTGDDPGRIALGGVGRSDPGVAYERLTSTDGVHDVLFYAELGLNPQRPNRGEYGGAVVAVCPVLARLAVVPSCTDGDVFVHDPAGADPAVPSGRVPEPGDTVLLPGPGSERDGVLNLRWRVPASAVPVRPRPYDLDFGPPAVLATPAALDLSDLAQSYLRGELRVDPADTDVVERVRNAVAFDRGIQVQERAGVAVEATFGVVRGALLIAALVTLLLAAASLLVLSLEQLSERRRALSMMVAAGCRRSTLAAAMLWQTLLPMLLATLLAVGIGAGLAALLLAAANQPIRLPWPTIGALAGATIAAALLITALTLPALRSATRPETLRTE